MAPQRERWARSVTVLRRITVFALLAVLLALLGGVGWGVLSEGGSRWLVERAVAASNGALELTGMTGSVAAGLAIDRIVLRGSTSITELDDIHAIPAWHSTFARGRLVFSKLSAARLQVHSTASRRAGPTEFDLPTL